MDNSLQEICNSLNNEFECAERKIIFWYDDKAEFIDDIDALELHNAEIHVLTKKNQFKTKYMLEREDTESSYLLYAPFSKPLLQENHLADILLYSKTFSADKISVIAINLGIPEEFKPLLEKYSSFFTNKKYQQKFSDLHLHEYDEKLIEKSIIAVLCGVNSTSIDEIVRRIISSCQKEQNYIEILKKYNIEDRFWNLCFDKYGYNNTNPQTQTLLYTLFSTYVVNITKEDILPDFISKKAGNIITFLREMMNNNLYTSDFDNLSKTVWDALKLEEIFKNIPIEKLLELDIFINTDTLIINKLFQLLLDNNTSITINNNSIAEICKNRQRLHYGKAHTAYYKLIENAYTIICTKTFTPNVGMEAIRDNYITESFKIDQAYRYFYYYYDRLDDPGKFVQLQTLVENIYTNCFLNPLLVAWSTALIDNTMNTGLVKQASFYNSYIKSSKERVVVIISDAFRYEVAQSLMERLSANSKFTTTISCMQTMLPSITQVGMSSLLPNTTLKLNDNYELEIDNKTNNDLASREKILQSYNPKSKAVKCDEITTTSSASDIIKGQEVVYIYHDQIDARGDKLSTENEVFTACEEAIKEICKTIEILGKAKNNRFFITADHGFLYKRNRISEEHKIDVKKVEESKKHKRYIFSKEKIDVTGTQCISIPTLYTRNEDGFLSFPSGSDIFKCSGSGECFVHGGISPQEMIIPLVEVRTSKANIESRKAEISLVSSINRITNLTTNISFIQTEALSENCRAAKYTMYFADTKGSKISQEVNHTADNKDSDVINRKFSTKFILKNKKYNIHEKYYFIIFDTEDCVERLRQEVKIDLPFSDDFGFNI